MDMTGATGEQRQYSLFCDSKSIKHVATDTTETPDLEEAWRCVDSQRFKEPVHHRARGSVICVDLRSAERPQSNPEQEPSSPGELQFRRSWDDLLRRALSCE